MPNTTEANKTLLTLPKKGEVPICRLPVMSEGRGNFMVIEVQALLKEGKETFVKSLGVELGIRTAGRGSGLREERKPNTR